MDKETSAYLDCVRLLAALAVMICHINGDLVFNIFPHFAHFGVEAVGVFFVLSGFVIGYVTDSKEKTLKIYAVNRAARIYSVVIPCLFFTFLLDSIGRHFQPTAYHALGSHTVEALHILFSLTFLNYTWLMHPPFLPGSDGPYWSLSFEVAYYVAFGAAFFLRGYRRWLVPIAVFACTGPIIAVNSLCWLAGLGIYRLCRDLKLSRATGWVIFIASLLLWAGLEALLWGVGATAGIQANSKFGFMAIYAGALPFAISVLGFHFTGLRIRQFTAPARWLAGASFTLYLFHFPFAACLNGLLPASMPHALRWAILVFSTLGATLVLAHFTERRKHLWRIAIEKILTKFEARKAVPL